MSEAEPPKPPADAETITRLRGDGPRVVRLSRKAIGFVAAAGLALVAATLIYALQPSSTDKADELFNPARVVVTEKIAGAPRDYSQIPQLGQPLPGDLGKPILDAQDRGAIAALPPVSPAVPVTGVPGQDPRQAARELMAQEREAARQSRLFVTGSLSTPSAASLEPEIADRASARERPPQDTSSRDAPRLLAAHSSPVAAAELAAAPAAMMLQAGSVIPAALITGIQSDQPGLVTAQVTENVYDSLTGRYLLIPQGSRLIGEYQSDTGFGQRRVILVWNRLILPDGGSFSLDGLPGADPSGYSGLEDGVDYHWGGVVKAASVSTILALGAELSIGGEGNIARALQRGSQDSLNRAGEQIVARELNIRPTLTVRPGFPVRVLVTRDLVLEAKE